MKALAVVALAVAFVAAGCRDPYKHVVASCEFKTTSTAVEIYVDRRSGQPAEVAAAADLCKYARARFGPNFKSFSQSLAR